MAKRRSENLVPVSLAVLLHVLVFGSLVVIVDFDRRQKPMVPLRINATLVTENAVVAPPQPRVEEPPVPEPDTAEQERIAAEQAQREQSARDERARLQKIERAREEAEKRRIAEEAERRRLAEEEEKRRQEAAAAEQRRKEAAAEEERRLQEAERQRQADIERQRLENERLQREAEAAARQQALDNEAQRMEAMEADAKAAYVFAIAQKIQRSWVAPPTAKPGIECVVRVRQLPGGEVVSAEIGTCNGDDAVKRSIESAVHRASPLPAPRDPRVFERDLNIIFSPEE